jgi:predicted metal-dependent hydrolase
VQVDKAYSTRKNRKWLTQRNIRITAKPLGRKPKQQKTSYQKAKDKKESAERNHIEAKFGQGKNGYNLNKIKAKLKSTSESWVSCIFFVMNLINYQRNFLWLNIFSFLG